MNARNRTNHPDNLELYAELYPMNRRRLFLFKFWRYANASITGPELDGLPGLRRHVAPVLQNARAA